MVGPSHYADQIFGDMYLNFFDIIILFGALQGLILSLILFFSKPDDRTPGNNIFLAALLLILAYNGLETFSWSSDIEAFDYYFNLLSNVLIFGLGPCLYLYVRSYTRPDSISTSVLTRHFAVVGIQFSLRVLILVVSYLNIQGHFIGLWSADLDALHKLVSDKLSILVFIFYLIISAREVWVYQIEHNNTDEDLTEFKWVRALVIGMGALGLAWAISTVYPIIVKASGSNYYYPLEVLQVLFIYWLGITGFYKIKVVQADARNRSNAYYESLPDAELNHCVEALTQAMEVDKLYLDANLNVQKLASHIRVSPKTLSAVLNQQLNKGFNEYVNYYRVEEVKSRLANPKYQLLTIAGIAHDSGFNSLATFQRVFKASTGITPKQFMASRLVNTANKA